jgi:hypothetical protein
MSFKPLHLNELRSLDLIIEYGSRLTDVDFIRYRITKEALEILDDKDKIDILSFPISFLKSKDSFVFALNTQFL